MRIITILSIIVAFSAFAPAQTAETVSGPNITGKIDRYKSFESKQVDARNVDVWLPPGFSPKKKYAVIYMHDGQMLFDFSTTWNKQEWHADETLARLMDAGKVRDTIIVGVWNTPKRREEYMPQKAFEMASADQRKEAATFGITAVFSDKYLRFLVEELKPFIDKTYPTKPDRGNTFVMGSSMGGLISLYAISEYPNVFGGAGCLSTHFPAGNGVMVDYMRTHLPSPKKHRIYFDYGTETLDAMYEPFQMKADDLMRSNGFSDRNWVTKKFEGDDHSEKSWAKRLEIPLEFLLGKRK